MLGGSVPQVPEDHVIYKFDSKLKYACSSSCVMSEDHAAKCPRTEALHDHEDRNKGGPLSKSSCEALSLLIDEMPKFQKGTLDSKHSVYLEMPCDRLCGLMGKWGISHCLCGLAEPCHVPFQLTCWVLGMLLCHASGVPAGLTQHESFEVHWKRRVHSARLQVPGGMPLLENKGVCVTYPPSLLSRLLGQIVCSMTYSKTPMIKLCTALVCADPAQICASLLACTSADLCPVLQISKRSTGTSTRN